jgi:hypothetical protein
MGAPAPSSRQRYALDEIKAMLIARAFDVAQHYAPPVPGAHIDKGGWWTLNPGRADRSVGSFVVWIEGPKVGSFRDFASGDFGDLLDLIQLSLGCSVTDALREARGYLGLQNDDPAAQRIRAEAIERGRRMRAEAEAKARADAERRARQARAIWLAGREALRGTPVEFYLRDQRGIDLAALGRQPRALRYVPELFYTHVDGESGEIIEGRWPAMVAMVTNGRGESVAVHRTWLAQAAGGGWGKAPVPEAKKVLGNYAGAAIHIWSGIGPRGGKAGPLSQCGAGAHVYLTEGIEDALSVVALLPEARVLAGISLSNIGQVVLPLNVATLTIVADQDEGPEQQAALARAVERHAAQGRAVRLWQNRHGGKDLNDALRAAISKQKNTGAGDERSAQ